MNKYFFLLITLILFSCKSDGPDDPENPVLKIFEAVITTLEPTNIKANTATFRGNLISMNEPVGNTQVRRGVCWSSNANPTLNDFNDYASGSGLGNFNVDVGLEENTSYHLRAFVVYNGNIIYGDDLLFTTPKSATLINGKAINILPDNAILYANLISNIDSNIFTRNFCLSVDQNPDINDFIARASTGDGEYTVQIDNLQPNTTYYVKAFTYANGNYIYGDEYSFKTTGYYGNSGGYIFFDKGEITDGWRYLEATSTPLNGDYKWGCSGTFISNTFPDIGKGLENTQVIINSCSDSDCAAYVCSNFNLGSVNDWFLPSYNEIKLLEHAIDVMADFDNDSYGFWTSTQFDRDYAKTSQGMAFKHYRREIWPIRRF